MDPSLNMPEFCPPSPSHDTLHAKRGRPTSQNDFAESLCWMVKETEEDKTLAKRHRQEFEKNGGSVAEERKFIERMRRRIIGSDEVHPTAEEKDLINADYWYDNQPYIHNRRGGMSDKKEEEVKRFYRYSLDIIRKPYNSIKETRGSRDLVLVLRDDFASSTLMNFAFCLGRIKETLLNLEDIIRTLTTKDNGLDESTNAADLQAVEGDSVTLKSSAKSEELKESAKGKCLSCSLRHLWDTNFTGQTEILSSFEKFLFAIEEEIVKTVGKPQTEEDKKSSVLIYNILLILKEILIEMKIHPQVSEGDQKDTEMPKVACKMKEVTAAEDLCIKCGVSLNPAVDSKGLKAVQDAVNRNTSGVDAFRGLIESHLGLFQKKIKKGCVKQYFIDNQSAELMSFVEAGASLLMTTIGEKSLLLTELLECVFNSSEPHSDDYQNACACEEQLHKLSEELLSDLEKSTRFLSGHKEIFRIFGKIVESINYRVKWQVLDLGRPKWMHMPLGDSSV